MKSTPLEQDTWRALCTAVDDAFETRHVPWLEQLVNAPSHTWAREDVEAAATILDETAAELGLDVRRVSGASHGLADHRVYSSPATGPGTRALALVGHVDTVFPRSMGFLEFSRPDRGDVAKGPGVLDMKSGVSVIFFALDAVRRVLGPRYGELPVRAVIVTDEEVGSPSSRALYAELAPVTTAALVFEAGRDEDRIVTARKGGGTFTLEVFGNAAHAGNRHEEGVNAIHALARLVPAIEALTDYERGVTVNVGLIEGGTAKNTVPDHARCVIDTRFRTRADADELVAALEALCSNPFVGDPGASALRLDQARAELSGGITRYPMEATPQSQALRLRYEPHAAASGLRVGEAPRSGGGSDANLLADAGVPCIDGLGPYGKGFHQKSEWCSLDSLRRRTQAMAGFLAAEIRDRAAI